ncbi:type II secretion system protein GspM [Polynucleobacter arcticus]
MNQRPAGNFSEKIMAALKQLREVLSKDYSIQDLKKLGSQFKNWQQTISAATASSAPSSAPVANPEDGHSHIDSRSKFDLKQLPLLMQDLMERQRKRLLGLLALFAVLIAALILYSYVLAPYAQRIGDQLELRPAQWSQLQNLVKLAKTTAASGSTSSFSAAPGTVTLLDDMELQKIRNVLTARGLKPSVLRLSADNPPRIEFQASDVMFSILLEALDEIRTTWRLYPEKLNVVATTGAGMVSINGVLMQYGAQVGVSR